PSTGRTGVIPTTQRACVPGVAGQAGLSQHALAPADALRAAQLWMLNPDRRSPPGLGDPLHRGAARTDLHEIYLWAAFTHQGNPAAR
ncbi:CHAT domain-containing protein, partial [Streptomyces sp. NPDC051662]|uniref:CHAT domain-containing protein n=1 Tax=Streptomyces sp. NPDC051662 TaxID=3154750 RepID=UPI003445DE58